MCHTPQGQFSPPTALLKMAENGFRFCFIQNLVCSNLSRWRIFLLREIAQKKVQLLAVCQIKWASESSSIDEIPLIVCAALSTDLAILDCFEASEWETLFGCSFYRARRELEELTKIHKRMDKVSDWPRFERTWWPPMAKCSIFRQAWLLAGPPPITVKRIPFVRPTEHPGIIRAFDISRK